MFFFEQAVPAPPPPPGAGVAVYQTGGTVQFFSSNNIGGLTKGAPYSAEAVTETIQTLADGNRIVNKTTTRQFRDSEGRERREMTMGERGQQMITISDPVAGVNYTLDPARRTASKSFRAKERAALAIDELANKMKEVVVRSSGPVSVQAPPGGRSGGGRGVAKSVAGVRVEPPNQTVEDLGTRNIEGVMATGKRTRVTIPAGQIGNDRPLETVMETWYSQELKMTVLDEMTDPRSGKTTMRLTNIIRSEPSRLLFEPPPDYAVNEGPGGATIRLRQEVK